MELGDTATAALIDGGWEKPGKTADGFANHGERVSTMVALARALGYSPSVGAMQANFGTPQENGLIGPQAGDGTLDPAEREVLEQAIADAKPGNGPASGWETVDLDVNGDGVVDKEDLDLALAGETGEEDGGPTEDGDTAGDVPLTQQPATAS